MANGSFLRVGVRLADGQKRYKNRFALANDFFPFQADAFPFQAESFFAKTIESQTNVISLFALCAERDFPVCNFYASPFSEILKV